MTYRIQHYNPDAVATPRWQDLKGPNLPMPLGWAFLVDVETEIPHRETTLFLAKSAKKSARKRGNRTCGNTTNTYASELKGYCEFLQWHGLNWSEAEPEILFGYIHALCERRHWLTGEELDGVTLSRRVRRVLSAYEYTNKQGISEVELDQEELLAELWEAASLESDTDAYRRYLARKMRHIGDAEYAAIAAALGTPPSQLSEGTDHASGGRNRLIGDLGITTGMRGAELADLPLAPFLAVNVTIRNLDAWTCLSIVGKGAKTRNIFVGNALVREIQAYARGRRAIAVACGEALGRKDPGTVLVNGPETGAHAGRPMRAQQLSTIFREAVRKALPVEPIEMTDEHGTHEYHPAKFRLHDLRHSFAMRLFNKLTAAGRDPWDILQARLGHKHVDVTRGVYLDMSRSFEPETADLVAAGLDALIHA